MLKRSNIDSIDLDNEFEAPECTVLDEKIAIEVQRRFDTLIESDEVIKNIFLAIEKSAGQVVIFGGWVRDQVISIKSNTPINSRDIDVVVDLKSNIELAELLTSEAIKNIFGGFSLKTTTTTIDIWEIKDTYLYKHTSLEPSLENLPKTTVFTINSIIFFPKGKGRKANIQECGFLQSVSENKLYFQSTHIPYPKIQVARAAIYSAKFSLTYHSDIESFINIVCTNQKIIADIMNGIELHSPLDIKQTAIDIFEKMSVPSTNYFKNCWGVFEGGGVRAAALAGAYQAATNSGVNFGRVAGTSAGSIVAALIAAGASPQFINQELASKNFHEFMSPSNMKDSKFHSKKINKFVEKITPAKYKFLMKIVNDSGLYSSNEIQSWLNDLLSSLLMLDRTVCFKDLKIPLYVVASDVVEKKARVWSRETTPDESVAFAVRCSSSIPLYFQPVSDGSSLLVDGGMISNLPAWVFSVERNKPNISSILCLRLKDSEKQDITNIRSLFNSLASTVIDGGTSIQLQLQSNIYVVDIPTGDYKATDFDKIDSTGKNWLHSSGYQGVKDFIEQERVHFGKNHNHISYQGWDEYLLLLVQHIASSSQNVVLLSPTTYWLYFIFPTIALAIQRGVSITVIFEPIKQDGLDNHEKFRRLQLENLRVETKEVDQIPFEGALIDTNSQNVLAVVKAPEGIESEYKSDQIRIYTSIFDFPIIKLLRNSIDGIAKSITKNNTLTLCSIDYDLVYDYLRKTSQYKNAKFSCESINVDKDVYCLDLFIKEYKLTQVMHLAHAYELHDLDIFTPASFQTNENFKSIVTPPILEKIGNTLYIIEGVTRFFYALRNGIEKLDAVVVENVTAPLPAKPHSIANLSLASDTLDTSDLYSELIRHEFRNIEASMHPFD